MVIRKLRVSAIVVTLNKCWRRAMQACSRNPEAIAAWTVAVGLVFLIGLAPWERLGASDPVGVVDVAKPRFEVKFPGAPHDRDAEARHDTDLYDLTFGPEGP
jgi:hypothetical protein